MNSFRWVFNLRFIEQEFIPFISVSIVVLIILILSFIFVKKELKKNKIEEGKKNEKK